MIFIYICFLIVRLATGCPQKEVPPCTCTMIGYHTSTIRCVEADNVDSLRESINNMRSTPIKTVQIFDSNILYIPHNLFKGLEFENLVLSTTSLMSLSDTDTAFVGLEKSLKTIFLQECPILNGLEWSQLRNLAELKEIRTVKLGLEAIDDEVKGIAGLNLTNLLLTKDKISYVSEKAFSTFHYLHTLSLKSNLVSNLTRSMFPNPANELAQLILSHNKLTTLPRDFFTNMPKLASVILADNGFLTLDQDIFAPVWKNLFKIDVTGNAIRCDCRMKWILRVPFPKNFWGECAEPLTVHGKEIKDLNDLELWC